MQRLSSFLPAFLLALGLSAPTTSAQTVKVVIQQGNVVLALGAVENFQKLAITNSGLVFAEINSDNPDGNRASAIIRNGFLTIQEGLPLAEPGGEIKGWDDLDANAGGHLGLAMSLRNTPEGKQDDRGLYWNLSLISLEGQALTAPQAFTNMAPRAFSQVRINDNNFVLTGMTFTSDETSGANNPAVVVFEVDPGTGTVLSESVPLKQDDPVGGTGGVLNALGGTAHAVAFNNNGDWLIQGKLTGHMGGTSRDTGLILNGNMILREGDPTSVGNRTINDMLNPELDMNDMGDWVANGSLSVQPNTGQDLDNAIILRNGEIFVRESETFPDISPETIDNFGAAPVYIGNSGDVYWYAATNGPSATNAYYFRNKKVIVQKGVTMLNGRVVDGVKNTSYSYYVSDSGRYFLAEVDLQGLGEALIKVDFGAVTPVPGCQGNPGSLVVSDGAAVVGGSVTMEMDSGQAAGVTPIVLFSTKNALPGSPCGFNTNAGEVLISLGANKIGRMQGTPWNGSDPVSITANLPNDLSLVDAVVWGQGLFFDTSGTLPTPIQLTNGLRFEIGAP